MEQLSDAFRCLWQSTQAAIVVGRKGFSMAAVSYMTPWHSAHSTDACLTWPKKTMSRTR